MLENSPFAEQVTKAEEGIELFYLPRIRTASLKEQYWRAAAWALERRLPNRYGVKKSESLTAERKRGRALFSSESLTGITNNI